MLKYAIKRLALLFVTLFGITLITFVLTRLTPGEPGGQTVGGSARGQGGYEDMLESNRRNLGLDKPLLINTNFEDRLFKADSSVDDFLRPAKIWQTDGRKNLVRISTIALEPVFARLDGAPSPTWARRRESREAGEASRAPVMNDENRKRLIELLPSLAVDEAAAAKAPKEGKEAVAYWKAWYGRSKHLFTDEAARGLVNDYLAGRVSLEEMRKGGGYCVQFLVAGLSGSDEAIVKRANAGLAALTGFNYILDEANWQAEKGEVVRKWRSMWKRERVRYLSFGPVQHTINILANTQFGLWVKQVATLDFGESYRHKRSVIVLISQRIPISLLLSGLAITISYALAIPLGIFSAIRRKSFFDKILTVTLFILYSVPTFWMAQMLLLTLTGKGVELFPTRGLHDEALNLATASGWASFKDLVWHLVLPVTCLTYIDLAFLSRQMRGAMLEVVKQDYIRTAKAKGLSEGVVIMKHALRNSLIPILTISAGLLPELVAGSIIIESIFTIEGMGKLAFDAILNRDYPIINSILFFSAFLTLLGILISDLSYALVDPRISYD